MNKELDDNDGIVNVTSIVPIVVVLSENNDESDDDDNDSDGVGDSDDDKSMVISTIIDEVLCSMEKTEVVSTLDTPEEEVDKENVT